MKYTRWIAAAMAVLLLVAAPTLIIPNLFKRVEYPTIVESAHKGVYVLWHVEGFEGGSVSREAYLKNVALALEAVERNYFVLVRSVSEDALNSLLEDGQLPDMISFAGGYAPSLKQFMQPLGGDYAVRDVFAASGRSGGEQLALPYMAGGYALIGNEELVKAAGIDEQTPLADRVDSAGNAKITSVVVGKSKHLEPLAAVSTASDKILPQYDAYEYFVNRRAAMLLGTQRDLNRLNHRESLGRGIPCRVQYVDNYTDIVQYIAVVTSDAARREASSVFVDYLSSAKAQRQISAYGMFSVGDYTLYSGGTLAGMEAALRSPTLAVRNIFG